MRTWLRAIPDADLRAMTVASYELQRWVIFTVCSNECTRRINEGSWTL